MNWKLFVFDVPIAVLTVAIAAQLTTHYDLATDWRAAGAAVLTGAAARLAPEAIAMLMYYRSKVAGSATNPPPVGPTA